MKLPCFAFYFCQLIRLHLVLRVSNWHQFIIVSQGCVWNEQWGFLFSSHTHTAPTRRSGMLLKHHLLQNVSWIASAYLFHVLRHFRHDSTKISGAEDRRDGSQRLPPLAGSLSALPAESTGSQNVSTGFTWPLKLAFDSNPGISCSFPQCSKLAADSPC
jgi:hypothetical protein